MKKYNNKVEPSNDTEYSKPTPSVDVEKIRKAFNSKWEALFTYDRDTTNGFNPYLRCENKVFDFFQPYLQPQPQSISEGELELKVSEILTKRFFIEGAEPKLTMEIYPNMVKSIAKDLIHHLQPTKDSSNKLNESEE